MKIACHQITRAAHLWRDRVDTAYIAAELRIPEASVYRQMDKIKRRAYYLQRARTLIEALRQ